MNYSFPDEATMVRYLVLLREVVNEARARVYVIDPQTAALLNAVESIPNLLCHWPQGFDDALADLTAFERKYMTGADRFSRILRTEPVDDWQLKWNW